MPARLLLYSLGTFGSSLLQQTVLLWVFFYYAPPAGQDLPFRIAPSLMGVALAAGRIVDALADPPVAYLSDRLRGRGGRRRPFILLGSPLLALSFVLLWLPPRGGADLRNFVYLATVLSAFYFLFTLVLNPYMALLPQITPPGARRVDTAAWQAAFSLLGTATAFTASSFLSARYGFAAMGLALAPVALAALWAAGLSVREGPVAEPPPPFVAAARAVLAVRPFQIYLVGLALLWFGLSLVNLSLAYTVTVLMGLPRAAVGSVLAVTVLAILASLPLIGALAKRYGKRTALVAAMGVATAITPLIGLVGLLPGSLSPTAQGYVLVALAGPPLAALFVLPNAILADLAEGHSARTGQRSEGMFFALQGLIFNGTTSLAAGVLGLTLQRLGYDARQPLGLRIVPLLAALAVAAGAAVFTRFPPDVPLRRAQPPSRR